MAFVGQLTFEMLVEAPPRNSAEGANDAPPHLYDSAGCFILPLMKAVHLVMAKQPTKQALQVAHQPPPQPPPPVVPRVPTARVRAESWPILQSRTEEEGWHGLGCSLPLDIPRVRATPWDDAYITHGIAEPLAEEDEYDDDARISCAHDDDDDDDGTSVDSRGYTSPLGHTSPLGVAATSSAPSGAGGHLPLSAAGHLASDLPARHAFCAAPPPISVTLLKPTPRSRDAGELLFDEIFEEPLTYEDTYLDAGASPLASSSSSTTTPLYTYSSNRSATSSKATLSPFLSPRLSYAASAASAASLEGLDHWPSVHGP